MSSNLIDLASQEDFTKLLEENKSSIIILDFWAGFATPCLQMNDVFAELAKKYQSLKFVKIEAEKFPDLSQELEVEAVPTFIVLKNGKLATRVNGANPPELSSVAEKYAKIAATSLPDRSPSATTKIQGASTTNGKGDLNTRLEKLTNEAPVMVFIKGTPSMPLCGFSRQIVEILNENKIKYSSFDILTDEEVRQGLKTYSDWPTYPQLYIKGELAGGLDIVKELVASGKLQEMIPKEKDLNERLEELVTRSSLMLFMKGEPSAPRCGFSSQVVSILDEKKLKYDTFDILQDEEVRKGLKTFANWPTYPMLFHKGELIGGLDIIKEMDQSGELDRKLADEKKVA